MYFQVPEMCSHISGSREDDYVVFQVIPRELLYEIISYLNENNLISFMKSYPEFKIERDKIFWVSKLVKESFEDYIPYLYDTNGRDRTDYFEDYQNIKTLKKA